MAYGANTFVIPLEEYLERKGLIFAMWYTEHTMKVVVFSFIVFLYTKQEKKKEKNKLISRNRKFENCFIEI